MKASRPLAAILMTAALVAGCATPERSVLDRFFVASRLRDKTALAPMATVIFEPLEHGIVTSFEIVRVTRSTDGSKTVIVDAPVRLPDGRVEQRSINLTMERRGGRWLVTAFRM